jgi:hypothetical protein
VLELEAGACAGAASHEDDNTEEGHRQVDPHLEATPIGILAFSDDDFNADNNVPTQHPDPSKVT